MSRPFPYPALKKEDQHFNLFIRNFLDSAVDLHRVVGQLQLVDAPTSKTSAGSPYMIAFDENYFYYCHSTNVWERIAKDNTW